MVCVFMSNHHNLEEFTDMLHPSQILKLIQRVKLLRFKVRSCFLPKLDLTVEVTERNTRGVSLTKHSRVVDVNCLSSLDPLNSRHATGLGP